MRIVYCGSGSFGCESLRWLHASEHVIPLVVTQPARPAGRGRKLHPTPISLLAQEFNLPCLEIPDVKDPQAIETIKKARPDVILIIAFGQKIGRELLNLPDCRVINLHSSLLPKYRGAAPVNWAIINGEKITGLTIFELDEGWDTGEILGQSVTKIGPCETAGELHDRLAEMGPELIENVLNDILNATDQPLQQNETAACPAPKLTKADGVIDWERPANVVKNQILGMWPWPGAFCLARLPHKQTTERLTICRAELVDTRDTEMHKASILPGTLTEDRLIECGDGQIRPLEVLPVGSKVMDFQSYINGRHLKPGDRFLNGKL